LLRLTGLNTTQRKDSTAFLLLSHKISKGYNGPARKNLALPATTSARSKNARAHSHPALFAPASNMPQTAASTAQFVELRGNVKC
jgi:hypothetical protein